MRTDVNLWYVLRHPSLYWDSRLRWYSVRLRAGCPRDACSTYRCQGNMQPSPVNTNTFLNSVYFSLRMVQRRGHHNLQLIFITARQRSCGKVMFSVCLSVILFTGKGPCTGPSPPSWHLPTCLTWTSLYRHTPSLLQPCSLWSTNCPAGGQLAFDSNAFLFSLCTNVWGLSFANVTFLDFHLQSPWFVLCSTDHKHVNMHRSGISLYLTCSGHNRCRVAF